MIDLTKLKIEDCVEGISHTVYIVSAITSQGEVECVQLDDAEHIVRYPLQIFAETFTIIEDDPVIVIANEDYNLHKDSPLSSALIKTSRIVATLNALVRVTLRAAPPDVKTAAVNALGATKALLSKLVEEVRED